MDRVRAPSSDPLTAADPDGFGERRRGADPEAGDAVELLELSKEFVAHAAFVAALGERVAHLTTVRHTSYVRLRRLDRPSADRLVLVSDFTPGWRLSALLQASAGLGARPDVTVVISILRQLLPAVSLFSRHNRDWAIGTLGPERLFLTPQARLVIAEHAFGAAIEKLNLGRDKLWKQYRVGMPPTAGLPRANARADAHAIGLVALSLLLGRVLEEKEFPKRIESLVDEAVTPREGQKVQLSPPLVDWLRRALQLELRTSFQTPHDTQVAFETVLISDRSYVTTPAALEQWLQQVGAAVDAARPPAVEELEEELPIDVEPARPSPQAPGQAAGDEPRGVVLEEHTETLARLESLASVPRPDVGEEVEEKAAALRRAEAVVEQEKAAAEAIRRKAAEELDAARRREEEMARSHAQEVAAARRDAEAAEAARRQAEEESAATRRQAEEQVAAARRQAEAQIEAARRQVQQELEAARGRFEAELEAARQQGREELRRDLEAARRQAQEQAQGDLEAARRRLEAESEARKRADAEAEAARRQAQAEGEARRRAEAAAEAARRQADAEAEIRRRAETEAAVMRQQVEELQRRLEEAVLARASAVEAGEGEAPPAVAVGPLATPAPLPEAPQSVAAREVAAAPAARSRLVPGLAGVVAVLLVLVTWLLLRPPASPLAGEGELVVQSRPPGARVSIDGNERGVTPLTLGLAAGTYTLEVRVGQAEPRVIPLTIKPGVQTSQYIELQDVAKTGGLQVRSNPPGARVSVDGQVIGTTPVTLRDLPAGEHEIILEAGGRQVRQVVRIEPGITADLVVPMPR